jgi:hypothetical protein
MLALSAGDYALTLLPERGGSMLRFTWRDEPLMRRSGGPRNRAAPLADWGRTWSVAASTPRSATLLFDHIAGDGAYVASQGFALDETGLTMTLSLVNLGCRTMPADIGFALASATDRRLDVVSRQGDDCGPALLEPGAVRSASLRLRATAAVPGQRDFQPRKLTDSLAKKSLNIIRVSMLR